MNLMRIRIIIVCMSLFMIVTANSNMNSIQDQPVKEIDPCTIENTTFQVGEELIYKVYYNWNFIWLSAGEVIFRVKEKEGKYYITADGATYNSYEWMFKVKDHFSTMIDTATLLPVEFVRDVNEGKYKRYEQVTFDQEAKSIEVLRNKKPKEQIIDNYAFSDCMHDMISILYFTRNIDFSELDYSFKFPIQIFLDKKVYPLNVKYEGKERKKIKGLGRLNTIKFSPEVVAGEVFDEDSYMNIWVSDDENKVPLLIESPVSVGSVKAVLKRHNGLKYKSSF